MRARTILRLLAASGVAMVAFAGCRSQLGLEPAPPGEQLREAQQSALTADTLSIRTVQVLEREGIAPVASEEAAASLRTMATSAMDADHLVALAEVSYALARRNGFASDLGWQHAVVASTASWAALFSSVADLSPFQSRAMLARHLHNVSLAAVVLGLPDPPGPEPAEFHRLVFGRDIVFRRTWEASTWRSVRFVDFVPVDDFRVRGLRNRHRQSGVGAALLGMRAPIDRSTADASVLRLPPTHQAVPFTAVLRDVQFLPGDRWIPDALDLAIYDPNRTPSIVIAGREVPLEADSSAALADTLGQSEELRQVGFGGLFRVHDWQEIGGLYMLEPFDPDRIPVVFVHGLVSSPLTWREMANDLWSDPAIRSRYQFWFFLYPTGQPFALSAAALRAELEEVRRRCDPEGRCRGLEQIVLIGHSMGGLVSRLLVTDPGTALWDSLSPVPFDQATLSDEDRELVTRAIVSPPVRGVTRVVFLAVPHRGSNLADRTPGRFASWLVQLPPAMVEAAGRVFQADGASPQQPSQRTLSNGIQSLSPQSDFLRAMADLPLAPGVTAHSIIGDRSANPGPSGTDGIVPYSSSHLAGVESELVIPNSDHSVTLHPAAIREVRRILREHAAITNRPASTSAASTPRP